MRKLYYIVRCSLETIKAAIHCRRCGFSLNERNVLCECVNLREAFNLMDVGFIPVKVSYADNGGYDGFYFRRTPALLMALDTYRKTIREAVDAVDYGDLVSVCRVPGSQISPISDMELENVIAPRGHVMEAFAYESWPVEMRQAYIVADAGTRRKMVDEVYQRG